MTPSPHPSLTLDLVMTKKQLEEERVLFQLVVVVNHELGGIFWKNIITLTAEGEWGKMLEFGEGN